MYKTVLPSVEGELFVCEAHFINKPARERTGNSNITSHAPKSTTNYPYLSSFLITLAKYFW